MSRYSECFPYIELASEIDDDDEVTASLAFVIRIYPHIDDDDNDDDGDEMVLVTVKMVVVMMR